MKINNIRFLGLGLISLLLLLSACEDFLTQKSKLNQTNELTLSTYRGLTNATIGAYSPLYSTGWYGRDFVVTSDLKSGNAKISPITSGRFQTQYQWSDVSTATVDLWSSAYNLIARANNVINALPEFSDPEVAQADLDNLKGECLFLRALGYFDLIRFYAQPYSSGTDNPGVPIVLVTEIGKPARNTVGEVYARILTDLIEAEGIINAANSHGNGDVDPKAWATQDAVKALLARVYLYMENWQAAANFASEIINSGEYQLYDTTTYTTWDKGGAWGTDAASEIIFEVYGAEGNSSHGNWNVISYIMSPNGYGDIGASMDVYDLYENNDIRKQLFRNAEQYPNSLWSLKYPGKGGDLREDNIPVLRLGEMYLIRAEAILHGATISGASALDDYNALREPLGLNSATTVSLNDIYDERRRELCFEGHQLFDLARTKRPLIRTDYDGSVNQNVPFPDYKWAMPIIQEELDANENCIQNEGY
jgi:starch-binding outer membrane protein, SusD/RagB family